MEPVTVDEKSAALHQLERAVKLFLDEDDFVCAITLAGAAEEVLGSLVKRVWETNAYSVLKKRVKRSSPDTTEKQIGKFLNLTRNSLKHSGVLAIEIGEPAFSDLRNAAVQMLCRAILNVAKLDGHISQTLNRFVVWLQEYEMSLAAESEPE